jgi:hypothetical protein
VRPKRWGSPKKNLSKDKVGTLLSAHTYFFGALFVGVAPGADGCNVLTALVFFLAGP